MSKSIANGILQVTGYNKEKKIIDGLLKGATEKPISIVFSKYSKGRDFVEAYMDESKNSHVPVGSFIHVRYLNKLSEKAEFYAGSTSSVLSKPGDQSVAYVAPIKVDGEYTLLRSRNNNNSTYKALFASVLDEDFTSIRKLNDLETTVLSLLNTASPMGYKAKRGVLLRIGYTRMDGEKKTIPVEFIPPHNIPIEQSVKQFVHHSPDLQAAINVAKEALQSPQGLFEVSGLSRVVINDYGKQENVERYRTNTAFVEPKNNTPGGAYSLASIVVNHEKGSLEKLNILDYKEKSPSGTVGVHGHGKNAFYQIEYRTKDQQQEINHQFRYPLRYKEQVSSSGKRNGIAIEGDVDKLTLHKSRIEAAVSGITPIKVSNQNRYVFPIQNKSQVLSSLSDLLGTPAIYTENAANEGKFKDSFILAGHTDKPFFATAITKVAEAYTHEQLNGDYYFNKQDRIAIETALKEVLPKPLLPSTGRHQTPRISYAQWVEDKYRGNGDQIARDLSSEIASVAAKMEVNWDNTASNIIIPPPGSSPELYNGQRNIEVDHKGHKGSAAILASSGYMSLTNKQTGKNEDLLTVTIKFFNKKLNSGDGEATFNSFHALLDKYNLDVGKGNTKNYEAQIVKQQAQVLEENKERELRLAAKRATDVLEREKGKVETTRLWDTGIKEDGSHAQLQKKNLSEAINIADIKRVNGRNPYFMYAIYDMNDQFAAIQKVYATPWDAGKGKLMNKVFSSNIPFTDIETGENNGLHGRIGNDDGQSPIYIGEGFANTLTSVYLKGGYGVVGLTKDNAQLIVSLLRNKYPDRQIIQVADNDSTNENGNVGVLSAIDSAWNSKISYVIPDFSKMVDGEKLNDISDLYVHGGAKEAKEQLGNLYSPPSDLIEYYSLRLKYAGKKKYQSYLDEAIKNISNEMSADDIERVAPSGLENYLSEQVKVVELREASIQPAIPIIKTVLAPTPSTPDLVKDNSPVKPVKPKVNKTSESLVPSEVEKTGVEIIEQISQKTNTPYLLVIAHDKESHEQVHNACEQLAGGKPPAYNQKRKGFIVPYYQKNPLAAVLHEKTGAPQLYFGKPYSPSTKGFVIRGHIDSSARDMIAMQLRELEHEYKEKEHGIVVSDIHALAILKPVLRQYTERSNKPDYFSPTAPQIPAEMLSDIGFLGGRLGVPSSHIIKAQALIKSFNKNVAEDGYMMATFYAKNAAKYGHLKGIEKHRSILTESINDAFSKENLHLFEKLEDLKRYAKALMETAEELGMIPEEDQETEVVEIAKKSPAHITTATTETTNPVEKQNTISSPVDTEEDKSPTQAPVKSEDAYLSIPPTKKEVTPEPQQDAATEAGTQTATATKGPQPDNISETSVELDITQPEVENNSGNISEKEIDEITSSSVAVDDEMPLESIFDPLELSPGDAQEIEAEYVNDPKPYLSVNNTKETPPPVEPEETVSDKTEPLAMPESIIALEPEVGVLDDVTALPESNNSVKANSFLMGDFFTPMDLSQSETLVTELVASPTKDEAIEANQNKPEEALPNVAEEVAAHEPEPEPELEPEPEPEPEPESNIIADLPIESVSDDELTNPESLEASVEELLNDESDQTSDGFSFLDLAIEDNGEPQTLLHEEPLIKADNTDGVEIEATTPDEPTFVVNANSSQNSSIIRVEELLSYMHEFVKAGYTPDEFEENCIETAGMPYFDLSNGLNKVLFNSDITYMRTQQEIVLPKSFADIYVSEYMKGAQKRMDTAEAFSRTYFLVKGDSALKTYSQYFRGLKSLKEAQNGHDYISSGEYNKELFESDLEYIHSTTMLSKFYDLMHLKEFGNQHVLSSESVSLNKAIEKANQSEVFENTKILNLREDPEVVLVITNPEEGEPLLRAARVKDAKALSSLADFDKLNIERATVDTIRLEDDKALYKSNFKAFGNIYILKKDEKWLASSEYNNLSVRYGSSPNADPQSFTSHQTLIQPVVTSEGSQSNESQTLSKDTAFIEFTELVKSAVNMELTYREFADIYLGSESLEGTPYHAANTGKIDFDQLRSDLRANSYTSARALFNHISNESDVSAQIETAKIVSFLPSDIDIMKPLSKSISNIELLKRNKTNPQDIVPFEQFLLTPSAMSGVHDIQTVPFHKLTEDQHLAHYPIDAYRIFAELNQVTGTDGITDKLTLAEKIVKNLTVRAQIMTLDEGSLAALPEAELVSFTEEIGIKDYADQNFTAKKLKEETEKFAKHNILKVAQFNYVATISQAQDDGFEISNRILREVSTITNGTLKSFADVVATRLKQKNEEQELQHVADAIQSNNILNFEDRVQLKANDFETPIIIGIENPKYVSRGKFQYAMTEGNTSENLILPSEISYYSMLSDKCIGVGHPIDNEYLIKYNLAPFNKDAIEYSLSALDGYLQKYGVIGAADESGNLVVLSKHEERFSAYVVGKETAEIVKYSSVVDVADTLLSRPLVFDTIDFESTRLPFEQYQKINASFELSNLIPSLTDEQGTTLLADHNDYGELTQEEKYSTIRRLFLSELSQAYRSAITTHTAPTLPLWSELVAIELQQVDLAIANDVTAEVVSEPASTFSVGERISNVERNAFGRITLMDAETVTVVPDWLYEARNKGSDLLSQLPLKYFNNMSANNFVDMVPVTQLPIDVIHKFNPMEESGIENVKNATEDELQELAHVLGITSENSLRETRNGVSAALNARVAAFELLNGTILIEDAKPVLEKFCQPCENIEDVKTWLLSETNEAVRRVQSYYFVKLMNECESFGYAKQEHNVTSLPLDVLNEAFKVVATPGLNIVSPGQPQYPYWQNMLNQDVDGAIQLSIDDQGVSKVELLPVVEESVPLAKYDAGQGLIVRVDNSYQLSVATGMTLKNGDIECQLGIDNIAISPDDVSEFNQETLQNTKDLLGLNKSNSFVSAFRLGREVMLTLDFPASAYGVLALNELETVIDLHSKDNALKVNEHHLGLSDGIYGYFDEDEELVAKGETIDEAKLALNDTLREEKDETATISDRNSDTVQSDEHRPLPGVGAKRANQDGARNTVTKDRETLRRTVSQESDPTNSEGHEDGELYSNGELAYESERSNNTDGVRNGDGRASREIYDFTKQQALVEQNVDDKTKFELNVSAIRILKELDKKSRNPTEEEQHQLGLYSGWGGLGKHIESYQYGELRADLQELVTDHEYRAIKASATTAFYTPVPVVQGVWQALGKMGFKGGKIYDPSMGLGNFYGLMPEDIAAESKLAGGELDSITAGIAKYLQPDVIVKNTGYEKSKLPSDYFDLMTSNIPFGNFKVHDPDYNKHNLNIHNYFIAKSLDKVKPGGVVAFITTTFTMDSRSTKARELFHESSDLVSAIRLPNNVFKKHAGTDVNADLVFFRKRFDHEPKGDDSWVNAEHFDKTAYSDVFLNNYFVANPHMVMGSHQVKSGQYSYQLANYSEEDFEPEFSRIVDSLPSNVFDSIESAKETDVSLSTIEPTKPKSPNEFEFGLYEQEEGCLVAAKGEIYMVEKRWDEDAQDHLPALVEFSYSKKNQDRLLGLIQLKKTVRHHMDAQINDLPAEDYEYSKQALNEQYNQFVKKYGPINSKTNISVMKADSQAPLLMGLDSKNIETDEYEKADIFTERTINVTPYPRSVGTVEEALTLSVAKRGGIDAEFIESLIHKSIDRVYDESQSVFVDPETNSYVHATKYLSGNLADKLKHAEQALELGDGRFQRNVDSLKASFPAPLEFGAIMFQLGSSWIPPEYIKQFIYTIATGEEAKSDSDLDDIFVEKCVDLWDMSLSSRLARRHEAKLMNEWGGGKLSAVSLINKLANGDKIEIATTIDGKRTVLEEATQQARQAAAKLKSEYNDWMGRVPERRQHICDLYNSTINVISQPKYDATHLQFTELNPLFNNKEFEPRPVQREAVVRYKVDGTVLLAHGVGSGKSFSLCAMAREGKLSGIHNKCMIAVPNNVYGQFARMFQQHYPTAKLLSIDSAAVNAIGRKAMTARIALNNWDAIIVPHSFLSKISAPPEFIINQIEEQAGELKNAMAIADGIGGYNLKRSERRLKSLQTKIENRLKQEDKDDLLYLTDLGIDALFIDESDNFLNLPTPSNMSHVSGVNTSESNRAMNLLFIARYLQEKNDGKGMVMATGTDIRKSMSDMYVNMYYLVPDELRKMGLLSFDSFMSTFGEVITAIEASPEGTGYRENSRLAKFNNLPELGQLYRLGADVVTTDQSGAEREKAEKIAVQAQGGEYFKSYMDNVAQRAQTFRNGNPNEEAWFSIQSCAQRSAFDLRMIDARIPEAPDCKINLCAENIAKVLNEDESGMPVAQLVFLDRYVNPTVDGFSPYDALIDKLVEKGIPRDKIITSREVTNETQKKNFQDQMNAGKYLVAIGTTEKFGVGNNIQRYLKATHELTPPWNPREIEQRSGRIERSGNLQTDLKMYRYSTENSFDLFQWEHIRRKALYIAQTKTNPLTAPRSYVEEVDASFEDLMAIATGNPLIKEKIDLDKKLDELSREKRMVQEKQSSAIHRVKGVVEDTKRSKRIMSTCEKGLEIMRSSAEEIELSGAFVNDEDTIEKAFKAMRTNMTKRKDSSFKFGTYKGLDITVDVIGNGPKKLPTLQGSTLIDGNEKVIIETLYNTGFVNKLMSIDEDFKGTIETCKHNQRNYDNLISSYEPLTLLKFEKDDELAQSRIRETELQTELVELANDVQETDSEDWEVVLARLDGDFENIEEPSLMTLME